MIQLVLQRVHIGYSSSHTSVSVPFLTLMKLHFCQTERRNVESLPTLNLRFLLCKSNVFCISEKMFVSSALSFWLLMGFWSPWKRRCELNLVPSSPEVLEAAYCVTHPRALAAAEA